MSAQFRHFDTKHADGTYIVFERIVSEDKINISFPCTEEEEVLTHLRKHDEIMSLARAREYMRDEWCYVGVQAKACVYIIRNGICTYYSFLSPGLWGIENDCGEAYLNEVFEEEKSTLRADLEALREFEELKG